MNWAKKKGNMERAVLLTLPRSEELQPKIFEKAARIAREVLKTPVKLCLGTNGECVTFATDGGTPVLRVQHEGHYWPILRGVAAAAVYVFGLNSKESMVKVKRAGKVPYEGDPIVDGSSELSLAFQYGDLTRLTAFFYHIHLLFRGTRYAYQYSEARLVEEEKKRAPMSVGNQAQQRHEHKRYNDAFAQSDHYDYELAARVQEHGFYD
jgi:hypothetical protein